MNAIAAMNHFRHGEYMNPPCRMNYGRQRNIIKEPPKMSVKVALF